MNLTNLSNEEISKFLLNGKKADAFELSAKTKEQNIGFVNQTIYKDKNMEIIFSYLKITENDLIQHFLIHSTWWGKIKNSYLTLEGLKGKTQKVKCGIININDLKSYNINDDDKVAVNNKNQAATIEISDFPSLVLYCQRKFKVSPFYTVEEVIYESPNSWVKIKITMPDGKTYLSEGISKKDAANRFAREYKMFFENLTKI